MIKLIKSLSIHHKLTLLIVAISIAVLSISAGLFYNNQIEILENSTVENARTQASLIGASVESAIIFSDERSADKTLRLLKIDPVIESAAVVLPDKKIFAHYNKNINEDMPEMDLNIQKNIGTDYLDIMHKIMDRDQVLGYIFIRSNLEHLKSERTYYKEILLAVILFSIMLAYVLSNFFQKIITVPIDIMVNHVKELSETKNYNKRLDLDLNDELGTLAEGFNHMLDVVQDREAELKNHSDHLQNIVDKRTEQLYKRANYDSLTNLPNRSLLLERLNYAISSAKRKNTQLAVLFMDLDRFKVINDTLGHDVGDQLLKSVSNRLEKTGREIDTVARLGGDEFVFLLEEINQPEDSARIAKRINDLFARPFDLKNHVLHITTSIGISVFPEDGDNSQTLLKNADVSMYHSKEKGPGNYSFYKEEMNKSSYKRLEIENHLRSAAEKNEFHLVYQPQVTLETRKINNVEALLRWDNPELGSVSPNIFIPIAEEIGIINQIGTWVITEACRQLDEWGNNGVNDITVAINISASHLLNVDLVNHIQNEVARFNIEFDRLELEITEEVFLDHSERTIEILKKIQLFGIKIAIDDFGTGYSSLRYLKNLPVDTLKLDGMFIKDLHNNRSSQGIVSSTIILAHSLNMKLVAECVETKEQLDFLIEQDCDLVQGFYLYKPLLPDEILKINN